MLKINDKYRIPDRWEELSPEQYLDIVAAMDRFEKGKTDFNAFKIEVVFACIGQVRPNPANELVCENIYRLSEQLTFPYKFHYEDARFDTFSPQNRRFLDKHLPDSSASDPEQRLAASFRYGVDFDLCFPAQLLPQVERMKGYRFEYAAGLANTSLTAEQYIDANAAMELYHKEPSQQLLDILCAILYCNPYKGARVDGDTFARVDKVTKLAILYNYIGVVEWVGQLEKYAPLFSKEGKKKGKEIVGAGNMIYSIAKAGYGTINQISSLPLFPFLDLLLKETVDGARQLASLDLKPAEIAEKMNLSIEQIHQML